MPAVETERTSLKTAYELADAAWMAEIVKAFPKRRPGNVRYEDIAHGEEGTPLRKAHDAYEAARIAWENHMQALRAASRPAGLGGRV